MQLKLLTVGHALVLALIALPCALGCGSDDDASDDGGAGSSGDPFGNAEDGGARGGEAGARGTAGASGAGGRGTAGTDAGGTAGATPAIDGGGAGSSDAGAADAGGAGGSGGGTPGGPMGTQPLGSVCANDGNCDQSMGAAVCCINTCTIADQCPDSPGYLPCNRASDCSAFGGAKICCQLGNARFCTKQSACGGDRLP